ncbi:hypothetical protein [Parapedobacter lycopersici]|uniref:hypothetical protein n=1 Tax=Parapedobacter lycopersici TaxID=1864939 RepID=UPI00334045A0
MVLILADFPNEKNRHEGMAQRILAIDQQIQPVDRQYLFVSHRRFFQSEAEPVGERAIQYRYNLFRHFFLILKQLRSAQTIYIHSVINLLPILPLFPFLRKKTFVILDAHGVVPEEQQLAGRRFKSFLYALVERMAIIRVNLVLVVTEAMETYLRKKYPQSSPTYVRYGIFPAHLDPSMPLTPGESITDDGLVRVIYSGNLQSWQNIDLMIQLIKTNQDNRIRYDILTGEPIVMKKRLAAEGVALHNVHVQTVTPSELGDYYRAAHYGIVLRDDIPVNRVACPTKLVEYLYYGMIPIVKSVHIGDFAAMGYEYLAYESFSSQVTARKSAVNQAVARGMIEQHRQIDIKTILTGK